MIKENDMNVKIVQLSDILRCPSLIILPAHYREDGTCYCDQRVAVDGE